MGGSKLRKFGLDDGRFYFYDGRLPPEFGGGAGAGYYPDFYPQPPPGMPLAPPGIGMPFSVSPSSGMSGENKLTSSSFGSGGPKS